MKLKLPFPEGKMNPILKEDKRVIAKGLIDKSLKDKEIIIKGLKEEDIWEIREILIEEIKRQKEEGEDGEDA
jgi:hypothetical protein